MRKWLGRLAIALVVLLIALGVAVWWAYRATQQVPQFYAEVVATPPEKQKELGYEFEQEALQLQNEVRDTGQWQAKFTADEINGWLAVDLPTKFQKSIPAGVSNPRVAIGRDMIQLACKVDSPRFSSVISLGFEPYLTDTPNELALRLRYARAGSLPLPVGEYLEEFTQRVSKAGIPIRWQEQDGDPVALLAIPTQREEWKGKELKLEAIELRDGELVLSGSTSDAKQPTEPQP